MHLMKLSTNGPAPFPNSVILSLSKDQTRARHTLTLDRSPSSSKENFPASLPTNTSLILRQAQDDRAMKRPFIFHYPTRFFILAFFLLLSLSLTHAADKRQQISLDGTWQIAGGSLKTPPDSFTHKVPVPGLVDESTPPFAQVGEKDQPREAFWYRTTFSIPGAVPDVARLKINRAIYGVHVLLNGTDVGGAVTGFSGCECDVTRALKGDGAKNELLVCVGAYRTAIPAAYPDGWDGEKKLYIPGIFDSVTLILAGNPYLNNVQVVPQIDQGSARVLVEIQHATDSTPLHAVIKNARTGDVVAQQDITAPKPDADGNATADFTIAIPQTHLWSPEDPFLYRLELTSPGDSISTRFGMREFHFDHVTHVPILNGKPYYLRGSNVTIFRFMEDSQRGHLPWNKDWVRKLHEGFKTMNWNALRYCIGAPPEFWYDIADETGILIEDEYPIWYNEGSAKGKKGVPTPLTVDALADEYTLAMRQRWNHPSIYIWDGQNESRQLTVTGAAIQKVRGLDLSHRPWDNGWGARQDPDDMQEAHFYLYEPFLKRPFHLWKFQGKDGSPTVSLKNSDPSKPSPIYNVILNEYDWLWVNRDGSPTKLTKVIWDTHALDFPSNTVEQRFNCYARTMADITEYWRSHRKLAGVLEFVSLGYSRPDGQTSDHFVDVPNLKVEPNYFHYMQQAFSPVGIMVDYWLPNPPPGPLPINVAVINDLSQTWQGPVTLALRKDGRVISEAHADTTVPPAGRSVVTLTITIPSGTGPYQIVGSLKDQNGKKIESLRDLNLGAPLPTGPTPVVPPSK